MPSINLTHNKGLGLTHKHLEGHKDFITILTASYEAAQA